MATEVEDKQDVPEGPKGWPKRASTFLRESWHEVRYKVTWPGWKEVKGTSIVVLVATLVFATYLGGLDYAMVKLLGEVWKTAQ